VGPVLPPTVRCRARCQPGVRGGVVIGVVVFASTLSTSHHGFMAQSFVCACNAAQDTAGDREDNQTEGDLSV
jgi:hypothetical protein